ncbi:MAG TPA: metallophosphoesterase [Syntrophales bacterium]|nr:metallophosphoesterase [Syntrophales bacterium]
MILFLVLYLLVYGGGHVYVFLRLVRAFSLPAPGQGVLGVFLAMMVLLPVAVHFLERIGQERAACLASWTGFLWMGVLFFALCLLAGLDAWNWVMRLGTVVTGADRSAWMVGARPAALLALGGAVLLSVYSAWEATRLQTERIVLPSAKVSRPVRIVQISDVHVGFIIAGDRVGHIAAAVEEARPDLVVSTGDLVDGQIDSLLDSMERLRAIRPPLGKFAVTGNHEFYAGLDQALAFTEGAGFTVLRGEGQTVGGVLNLAGVDDATGIHAGLAPAVDERAVLDRLDPGLFTVLLRHRPENRSATAGRFDLQLSGHTHKGQIFPFSFFTRMAFSHHAGDYRLPGGGLLHVSRGTGTWGPPMRFLAPPEITVIDLVPGPGREEAK